MLDVRAALVGDGLGEAADELRGAKYVLRVDEQERHRPVAAGVTEPVARLAAVQPDDAVDAFEPDRGELDRAVFPLGADDDGHDLLRERLEPRRKLHDRARSFAMSAALFTALSP
jgi:hypothetical protein